MLRITIPATDRWDERNQVFISTKECTLQLEHSLVSLSKWESKWCKPFLSKEIKTHEETIDYIRCMTITQNIDPSVYDFIPNSVIEQVNKYIDAPMTATWFSDEKQGKSGKAGKGGKKNAEAITSELIYYWMISLNIPFDCQKWHLNRLLTLVRVCDIKGQPDKKMTKKQALMQQKALNASRRKKHNTKG